MRLLDQEPMDPDIAEELAAIDATLAGEPVDPRHAELAELALLLRAERPQMRDGFSRSLDARANQHFVAPPAPKWYSRSWVWKPAVSGVAVAATVGMVLVLNALPGGGSSGAASSASFSGSASATTSTPVPAAAATVTRAAGSSASSAPTGTLSRSLKAAASPDAPVPLSAASLSPGGLTVPNSGRKITQSSQLVLTTAPNEIDRVAQELYNVVGAESGSVQSSNVTQTGGLDGNASFQLSIPSSALPATMARLSQLPDAHVASRTDSSQDVTNQFNSLTSRLSDAQALRTALLKRLALALTTEQVDSLNGQIHDADAEIGSYQLQLGGLNHQINYSQVSVTIGASATPVASHGGGSFTIGKSLHTAGRVLTVAAGVALIALAGLTPIALVVALIWWVAAALRRRRREHALDLA